MQHRIVFATIQNPAVYLSGARFSIFSTLVPRLNSTTNINTVKALAGCLCALSVNKLSHIPKLQAISAVYENQWCRIWFHVLIELSAFEIPTHFLSLRSDYHAKRIKMVINEMDLNFFAYILTEDTFKCMIGEFHHKMISKIILAGI